MVDKHNDAQERIRLVEMKFGKVATKDDIEGAADGRKQMKANFLEELASFQSYLKEQSSRYSKTETR